jgi:hydroxypyruvate isomerase
MEGNLIQNITENIGLIGHFHSADVPGRHEYGSGELNYANILRAIDKAGYQGFVGLEYSPSAGMDSAASLAQVRRIVGA